MAGTGLASTREKARAEAKKMTLRDIIVNNLNIKKMFKKLKKRNFDEYYYSLKRDRREMFEEAISFFNHFEINEKSISEDIETRLGENPIYLDKNGYYCTHCFETRSGDFCHYTEEDVLGHLILSFIDFHFWKYCCTNHLWHW